MSWLATTLSNPRAIVVLGLVLSSTSLHATSEADLTAAELVELADVIFVGTVRSEPRAFREPADIYTYYEFDVSEVIKGRIVDRPLRFRIPGGQVGDMTVSVVGAPRFKPGETYLIFAEQNDVHGIWLLGFYHGVYKFVAHPGDGSTVVADRNGRMMEAIREGEFIRTAGRVDGESKPARSQQQSTPWNHPPDTSDRPVRAGDFLDELKALATAIQRRPGPAPVKPIHSIALPDQP